jgi:hypothetical protein
MDRRRIHRVAVDPLIEPPDVVGARIAVERTAERDHTIDPIRPKLRDFARIEAAEAPSDQHQSRRQAVDPGGQPVEQVPRYPAVDAEPPALRMVARDIEGAAQARGERIGGQEAGKYHDGAPVASMRARQPAAGRRPKRTAQEGRELGQQAAERWGSGVNPLDHAGSTRTLPAPFPEGTAASGTQRCGPAVRPGRELRQGGVSVWRWRRAGRTSHHRRSARPVRASIHRSCDRS